GKSLQPKDRRQRAARHQSLTELEPRFVRTPVIGGWPFGELLEVAARLGEAAEVTKRRSRLRIGIDRGRDATLGNRDRADPGGNVQYRACIAGPEIELRKSAQTRQLQVQVARLLGNHESTRKSRSHSKHGSARVEQRRTEGEVQE